MSTAKGADYPVLTGTDNAALLKLVADYEAALRKCNADKAAVNEISDRR